MALAPTCLGSKVFSRRFLPPGDLSTQGRELIGERQEDPMALWLLVHISPCGEGTSFIKVTQFSKYGDA